MIARREDQALTPFAEMNPLADRMLVNLKSHPPLARSSNAKFSGRVVYRFDGETAGSLVLDLKKRTAVLRTRQSPPPLEASPFDGPVPLADAPLTDEFSKNIAREMLGQVDIHPKRIRVRSVPDLVFDLDQQGQIWRANFDLEKQQLKAKRIEDVQGPHWRSFLTRLHKTHVYQDGLSRFAWALIADIMALAMMIWGASGIYMWWRMKKLRVIGKQVLLASLGLAFLMGLGMLLSLSS